MLAKSIAERMETEIGRNAIASSSAADKFDLNYLPDAEPEKPIKRLNTKGLTECLRFNLGLKNSATERENNWR